MFRRNGVSGSNTKHLVGIVSQCTCARICSARLEIVFRLLFTSFCTTYFFSKTAQKIDEPVKFSKKTTRIKKLLFHRNTVVPTEWYVQVSHKAPRWNRITIYVCACMLKSSRYFFPAAIHVILHYLFFCKNGTK